MDDLNKLLKFTKLFHSFQQTKRSMLVVGEDRFENDAEHSYQVAITAWYVCESKKLKLDVDLIVKYALVHDLVEIYAGDTYIYDSNQVQIDNKKSREEIALKQIASEFPEVNEFWNLVRKYELKEDEESKFIYVIDKLLPVMNNYLDSGRSWKEKGVTLDMVVEAKTSKMAKSQELYPYWEALLELLKSNKEKLFTN